MSHPDPLRRRPGWLDLGGEWAFAPGAPGDEHREAPPVSRLEGRIRVPFPPQSRLSGWRGPVPDVVWYGRTFDGPAGRVLLHFGAVDYRATVWINGSEVARHEGGHTPFSVEVTGRLRGAADELVVRAEDPLEEVEIPRGKQFWGPRPEGIFYTPSTGIWQPVWLERLPPRSLSGVRAVSDPAAGAVEIQGQGEGRMEAAVRLEGREVARGSGRLELAEVRRWSPADPALYDVEVRLLGARGQVLDRLDTYFGLRIAAAAGGRFLLNGEPFVQRLVLDQGYHPGGLLAAPSESALRRDVELAQALGFNGARKHQKIEDPRWLYWADRLGFLVWEEAPAFHRWSPAAGERLRREWSEAVLRDRDHPCIVAWAPLNESFGLDDLPLADRAAYVSALYELTHELDGTRPVSSNDGWEHARTDLCTLHDYSQAAGLAARYGSLEAALGDGRPRRAFLPGFEYAGQPLLVSEFGGLWLRASGGWGWSEAAGPEDLARQYQAQVAALMQPGPVEGYCYTQLADVEQERNGLLTAGRTPKADPAAIRAANHTTKGSSQ